MKIVRMPKILRSILPSKFIAMTLFPLGIFYRDEISGETLAHEEIHWEQQKEMLCIFFYLWYLIEWLIKLLRFGKDAYWNISFEREAYDLDDRPDERQRYGWIKYLAKPVSLQKARKNIIRWKMYFDRARMYVSYVQFILIGLVFIKAFKGGISTYFFSHMGWTLPVMVIVFVASCLIIGYLDMKLGIRSEEYRALSEANPMMMELLDRTKKEEPKQPDLSYKGNDLSHEGLATKRQILGLTLRQVASLTQISTSTISRIEQGKECKLSNILKLIKLYEAPEYAAKIAITSAVEQELWKGGIE